MNEDLIPDKGYYIIGSFNSWREPVQMTLDTEGGYGYTMTLGENSFEQFQIWLDGDSTKVLHPGWQRAGKESPVVGPTANDESHGFNWMIDGRGDVREGWTLAEDVETEGEVMRVEVDNMGREWHLRQQILPSPDQGEPGDQYRVRLIMMGKWRAVSWEKIEAPLALPPHVTAGPGRYYVVGSWNNWSFEEMEPQGDGSFELTTAQLPRRGGEFQIVRDQDWAQVFYPSIPMGTVEEFIIGPRDGGHGLNWFLDGSKGDSFRITFRRAVEEGRDNKKISWAKLAGQLTN